MDPELLVGFAGAIGAGKNAAASSIPRAVVIEHADPIYWMLSAMLQAPVEDLRDRGAKETPIVGLGKSVRDLLRFVPWVFEIVRRQSRRAHMFLTFQMYGVSQGVGVLVVQSRLEHFKSGFWSLEY